MQQNKNFLLHYSSTNYFLLFISFMYYCIQKIVSALFTDLGTLFFIAFSLPFSKYHFLRHYLLVCFVICTSLILLFFSCFLTALCFSLFLPPSSIHLIEGIYCLDKEGRLFTLKKNAKEIKEKRAKTEDMKDNKSKWKKEAN